MIEAYESLSTTREKSLNLMSELEKQTFNRSPVNIQTIHEQEIMDNYFINHETNQNTNHNKHATHKSKHINTHDNNDIQLQSYIDF